MSNDNWNSIKHSFEEEDTIIKLLNNPNNHKRMSLALVCSEVFKPDALDFMLMLKEVKN